MSTDTQNNAPVSAEPVAVPDAILLMAQRIAADDFEHCTSDPIFTVEKRNLITGLDLDYTDNIGWFCEGEQIDDEDAAVLEAAYQESRNVPDNYTRTGIEETWEHFATYVTLEAAREFVSKKGDQYRVYVDSGCRNHEWKALRAFLLQIAAKPVLAAPVAAQPDLTQQDATLHAEVLDMVRMLEANEWADHCGKSELGQRLEWAITALQNRPQNIPEIIPESAQQDAETGETVLVKNQELIEPAIEQDGYGWDGGENPPNMVLYQCMAPFHLNLCRGQELRAVIDYGRLVWQQAKQDASKVDAALAEMVHAMFRSANSIPVTRITIDRKQYEAAIDAARKEPDQWLNQSRP